MDPYLEHHWLSVHARIVPYMGDALNETLPSDLRAEIEERVVVSYPEGIKPRYVVPDTYGVPDKPAAPRGTEAAASGVAVAEPIVVRRPLDEQLTEKYLHITDLSGSTVITAIELLSPTNKLPGLGRDQFLAKQEEYLAAGVNIVEIDLYRGGERTFDWIEPGIPAHRRSPYLVVVHRADREDEWLVYPFPLRERLSAVPVPLRPNDPQVLLDLQPLLDRAYANGRYPIDYTRPPEPPLSPEDAAWAEALLRDAGLR